jgi:hypothetical protein
MIQKVKSFLIFDKSGILGTNLELVQHEINHKNEQPRKPARISVTHNVYFNGTSGHNTTVCITLLSQPFQIATKYQHSSYKNGSTQGSFSKTDVKYGIGISVGAFITTFSFLNTLFKESKLINPMQQQCLSYSGHSPPFMKHEGSLACSQEPTTVPVTSQMGLRKKPLLLCLSSHVQA